MNTYLTGIDDFPLEQPFNTSPWNYIGAEEIVIVPENTVDWLLLDFRDAISATHANESTTIQQNAAFLRHDGRVIGLDGNPFLQLQNVVNNQLFIVISHRNHLDILSAFPLTQLGGIYTYDFSTDAAKVHGGLNGHKEIASGVWAMIAGDANTNGFVDDADKDFNWMIQAGLNGYYLGDFNMDSNVNNQDKNDFWLPNRGSGNQLP
jgi:hypothetical protein